MHFHGVGSAVAVQGVAVFTFPFAVALVLRRAIKPIAFFQKMEANARPQGQHGRYHYQTAKNKQNKDRMSCKVKKKFSAVIPVYGQLF